MSGYKKESKVAAIVIEVHVVDSNGKIRVYDVLLSPKVAHLPASECVSFSMTEVRQARKMMSNLSGVEAIVDEMKVVEFLIGRMIAGQLSVT